MARPASAPFLRYLPFRWSWQCRQKTGRSRRGLNGSRIGRRQDAHSAPYTWPLPSSGPGVRGCTARRAPSRRIVMTWALCSALRSTRHSAQRGDSGMPVPRRAASSPGTRSKTRPQSTQIGETWPDDWSMCRGWLMACPGPGQKMFDSSSNDSFLHRPLCLTSLVHHGQPSPQCRIISCL